MARPRVFISSTYFDLKSVRADLEHFIRERGFDPVLHERGSVAYGNAEALEKYCYKEIETCDILISIVGGRFGSKADDSAYSVSQTELKVALEQAKQVYIFVERDVYHEYRTFERNRDTSIKWASVDNGRIYEFLGEIYALKNNNPIQPFETSYDITENLKEQWAGLFQRLLAQQSLSIQASLFHDLKQSLENARSLLDVVASQADRRDEVVADLLLTSHPAFTAIRRAMSVPYRFVFSDFDEFKKWIAARGYTEDSFSSDDYRSEWFRIDKNKGNTETLVVDRSIFDDDGKLKPFSAASWSDSYVTFSVTKTKSARGFTDDLDDVPF
ncbi:DUF4062 domain-containing protein [uncultured Sphingomonas sp.]|uniref:DUF4062 domain-containing protein n=1 Tax=uncultured Sphingomonas sp. TaxID=158754 RepID=UPI0025E987F4|nr:DUF4062 domain-containing protein [uncultured Sphingomonas sp.]